MQLHKRSKRRTNERTKGHLTKSTTNGRKDKRTNGQTKRRTNQQTNERTKGQLTKSTTNGKTKNKSALVERKFL